MFCICLSVRAFFRYFKLCKCQINHRRHSLIFRKMKINQNRNKFVLEVKVFDLSVCLCVCVYLLLRDKIEIDVGPPTSPKLDKNTPYSFSINFTNTHTHTNKHRNIHKKNLYFSKFILMRFRKFTVIVDV